MKNRGIYCSTGTTVGRRNGYNYHLVTEIFPALLEQGIIDGAEWMMLPVYYEQMSAIADEWLSAGLTFPIIHCEKEVGTLISNAGSAVSSGDLRNAKRLMQTAMDDFKKNCEMGAMANSRRMVIHLWGGTDSDSHISYNLSALEQMLEIIRPYGIRLLIENVPCTTNDPLSNWKLLASHFDECGLIFDTRFGFFHRQIEDIWDTESVYRHVEHIHIGDIRGEKQDFTSLRPIYHPGEGMIDFQAVVQRLRTAGYDGSVTLESPVVTDGGADCSKLKASLIRVRELFT